MAEPRNGRLLRAVSLPLLVAIPVAAATVYVALVSPFQSGNYPVCPWYALTGLYDPGDGGLRAVHSFMHGNLLRALDLNAFVILLCGAFTVLWGYWLVVRVTARELSLRVVQTGLLVAVAVLPVFTVVRNLPFGQLLAP